MEIAKSTRKMNDTFRLHEGHFLPAKEPRRMHVNHSHEGRLAVSALRAL